MRTSNPDDGAIPPLAAEEALDAYVRAFENAYAERGEADPSDFLPPEGDPLRSAVLRELLRVDLEFGWERGRPKNLAEYQRVFPALKADVDGLRQIAFEEYRLRGLAGEDPSADEYLDRYGIRLDPIVARLRPPLPRLDSPASIQAGQSPSRARTRTRPRRPESGSAQVPSLPDIGTDFLGFRLIAELGHGAFGRVYLARQGDMADRPVVLKVTADGSDESQTLAQLQHENIVPVYSRHRDGRFRAICMPYLGSVTLRDVFNELKGQGALPESGRDLLGSLRQSSLSKTASLPPDLPSTSRPPVSTQTPQTHSARRFRDRWSNASPSTSDNDPRTMLGKFSYVDAVIWMGARLADGLAHAHDRGILHRDMKPANILLTDDGRPMLLDFNLAEDLKLPSVDSQTRAGSIGGTLPYMAPEHLAALHDGEAPVDARSDLFAFGVILFEMLTGRPPFPVRDGFHPDLIGAMIDDRRGPPPRLRPWNPAISPAVESVVRRCLDPDPARRYASARDLGEDLQRHLLRRPLRHAPDPSPVERISKWGRRNRNALVAVAGLAFLVGSGLALATLTARANRFEALKTLSLYRDQSTSALNLLSLRTGSRDAVRRHEGQMAADLALGYFHVRDGPDPAYPWWKRLPASLLPDDDLAALRKSAGDLLLMLARSELREGDARSNDGNRRPLYNAALRDLHRAQRCYEPDPIPSAVWSERSEALKRLGDSQGAALAAAEAQAAIPVGTHDDLFRGLDLLEANEPARALPFFESAVRVDPRQYWAWLNLGSCQIRLLHWEQAEACFSTCIALWPEHPSAWRNRGVVLRHRGKLDAALSDLNIARRLDHDDPETLADYGLTELDLGRPVQALRTFNAVLHQTQSRQAAPDPRLYFVRAVARRRSGDTAGADADLAEGLRREPIDVTGWNVRAVHRLNIGDYSGALADLDHALSIDPRSYSALQDRARVLARHLGRTEEALETLDRLIASYPDFADAWSDRALLLARLDRREDALKSAQAALDLDPTPRRQWQAAAARVLTAHGDPTDRNAAVQLLTSALTRAPDLVTPIAADADLTSLHDHPGYSRALSSARAVNTSRSLEPILRPSP